jgi:hypothetical protein
MTSYPARHQGQRHNEEDPRLTPDARSVAHVFHDDKVQRIARVTLAALAAKEGLAVLLNRAGTTFRNSPDAKNDG